MSSATIEPVEHLGRPEDRLELEDERLLLGFLLLERLPLEGGQAREAHVEDRLRLLGGKEELPHQVRLGDRDVLRASDDPDHLVDVVDRGEEPLEEVEPFLGLPQVELRAPGDRPPAVAEVEVEQRLEAEDPRAALDQAEVDHAEARLERCVLVEPVEDDLRRGVPPQLEDDARSRAVRFVTEVRDPVDPLRLHELGDQLEEGGLVDLVRDLRDDDLVLAAALADLGGSADVHHPPAGLVRLPDPVGGEIAPGREVRPGDDLHQLVQGRPGAREQEAERVDDLAQVVRRHVGRHADRDPGRSVDEEIRDLGREDERFLERPVEVVRPVDGLLLDVEEHLLGEQREPRLGVPHRGRAVAVDRAEVPLAVDERVAQAERLGHPHERVVDREVAVRVVLAEDVPDRPRALAVGAVVGRPRLPHRPEDAPVDRLQAVEPVGERPPDDHAHRVIDVRAVHLPLERVVADPLRGRGVGGRRGAAHVTAPFVPSCCPSSRFAASRNWSRVPDGMVAPLATR